MPSPLHLRPADADDARLLWQWANDAEVRSSSFSPDPIAWEDHQQWYAAKLKDDRCRIFIALAANEVPMGQIRFDLREDGDADVDVHLAPDQRGKGYGSALIAEGMRMFFAQSDTAAVHSFVKIGNDASRKAFLKAGFEDQGTKYMQGEEVYHLLSRHP